MRRKLAMTSLLLGLGLNLSVNANDIESILINGNGIWLQELGTNVWHWQMHFKAQGAMVYHFAGEGNWEIEGKYRIEKDSILIDITGKNPTILEIQRRFQCKLELASQSLKYMKKLSCGSVAFLGDSFRAVNERRAYDGVSIVTLGNITGKIRETAKFRRQPNLQAKLIQCKLKTDRAHDTYVNLPSLPQGHEVRIMGRTLNKEKVENWENYWYLIEPEYDQFEGEKCAADRGWVFGEFIDVLHGKP